MARWSGSVAGPFLASVIGAARIGTGYRPSFDVTNPAFREWVKLSVPLMLGVSLVTADDWILRHYASSGVGDITRLNLCQAAVCGADCGAGAGHGAGVAAVFCAAVQREKAEGICRDGE